MDNMEELFLFLYLHSKDEGKNFKLQVTICSHGYPMLPARIRECVGHL